MKTQHIHEIDQTLEQFYKEIIMLGCVLTQDELKERIKNSIIAIETTMLNDDTTMILDYGSMRFTLYKNADGYWELCENATFYPDMETGDDIIEVEITE